MSDIKNKFKGLGAEFIYLGLFINFIQKMTISNLNIQLRDIRSQNSVF